MIFPGVSTGSVYKDVALLRNGFPAESVNNGSVIAVKTHEWGPEVRNKFQAALLLVRLGFLCYVFTPDIEHISTGIRLTASWQSSTGGQEVI